MVERKNFSRLKDVLPIPDLIEIQTKSYANFLQLDVPPEKRAYQGLQEVFIDAFPPVNTEGSCGLEFLNYDIESPRLDVVTCLKDGDTYQAPLYATFRLHLPNQKETKEERVHIGEIPLMTERGSFVINGAERVIVSQLHRSPGVCFEKTKHASGKDLYSYKVIADHGSWLEVQYDSNDLMYIFLDRKHRRKKFLISTFLRAFGLKNDRELLNAVYGCFFLKSNSHRLDFDKKGKARIQPLFGAPVGDISDSEADLLDADGKMLPHWLGVREVPVKELLNMAKNDPEQLSHVYTAEAIKDADNEDVDLIESLASLTEKDLAEARAQGVKTIACVDTCGQGDSLIRCIQKEYKEYDRMLTPDEARKEIYRKLRPSDQPTEHSAQALFTHMFEDVHRYDMGRVGRYRLMTRLFQSPLRTLEDMISESEIASREKFGLPRLNDLKVNMTYFEAMVNDYYGAKRNTLKEEKLLAMLFSTNDNAYNTLFPEAAAFTHETMASYVKVAWLKFLRDFKMETVLASGCGVMGEFVKNSIPDIQEAVRKVLDLCGADNEENKKVIVSALKEISSMKRTALADLLKAREVELPSAQDAPKAGKKNNRSSKVSVLSKQQISALICEFLCGVLKAALNEVQEFLKTRRYLTKADMAASTAYLMRLRNEACMVDDIDHLGRRRLRTIDELLQNQCRLGLFRMANSFREKLNGPEMAGRSALGLNPAEVNISKCVSPKYLANQIRDFFGRNQLSQFMDQTNCLAEITNKRRLSALGSGGLTRERAGFEVRDVHPSHYGRICPIETPEGPNIGLISSLALMARIDEFGFINTPYRRVSEGKVSDSVEYLPADCEEPFIIAQANAPQDRNGRFINKNVLARHGGESGLFEAKKVDYIDVSPRQLISAAAGLIPFLEHDDANRALMGSNMQRQAVPLLKPERPVVGTGLEEPVARYSRAATNAREAGIVASSTAVKIIITKDGKMPEETAYPESVQEYNLYKFLRSNASTFVNQHPIVKRGDKIAAGQAIADSSCTDQGELALGRNVTVAYMSWHGYNYEDAIIISKRLVSEDVYTSIHVSVEDVKARDTKLGAEEITRDIPNLGEEALRNLDAEGVVRVGAEVRPGDILVGKITPKNDGDQGAESRLLKAIFGEKASDVKDNSLQVPGGLSGIVMDVRIERKADAQKEKMTRTQIQARIRAEEQQYKQKQEEILNELVHTLEEEFQNHKFPCAVVKCVGDETEEIIAANSRITKHALNRFRQCFDKDKKDFNFIMRDCEEKHHLDEVLKNYRIRLRDNEQCRQEAIALINQGNGEELGKITGVKVYIASKRRLSVGDKMAGRHGNKGIVSKIVPVEDMPFMADGTPVDIILNPLGVPSRMNIGQVFETHVGWAAKTLGMTVATPVFDGIHEEDITKMLAQARKIKVEQQGWTLDADDHVRDRHGRNRDEDVIGVDGKTRLYDGRSGEPFVQKIVVGTTYMLKLDHLVANKIHARACGPYSLVTQQPLGGKAQHGGQRFGEMEVWALEAYGAAYTLQEMLTVKSDDVNGRTRTYDSIMRGDCTLRAGIPESFNVLMREMMSLCLDVSLRRGKSKE